MKLSDLIDGNISEKDKELVKYLDTCEIISYKTFYFGVDCVPESRFCFHFIILFDLTKNEYLFFKIIDYSKESKYVTELFKTNSKEPHIFNSPEILNDERYLKIKTLELL